MKYKLIELFSLRHDQDNPSNIDAAIRNSSRLAGTNLWVLIFAILIASIGLNVNSTAVIIGAMLISPLMGPIIGIGYGAGINDFPLIRQAARNLLIFLVLSLTTSTLYFLVSPLTTAHSELLARTTPSLWDVLIAFFGGAAGIIGLTRRDKSPIIPGVAIATALMPPLCTAGYGLASGNWQFFSGAFFLFFINSVFIAFATLLLVKFLRLPQHRYIEDKERRHAHIWIASIVTVTLLPSIYLAYRLVQDEFFLTQAHRLVSQIEQDNKLIIVAREITASPHKIALTVSGQESVNEIEKELRATFSALGVSNPEIQIRRLGSEQIDVSRLKQEFQKDVLRDTLEKLNESELKIQALIAENKKLRSEPEQFANLLQEVQILYPQVTYLALARGIEQPMLKAGKLEKDATFVLAISPRNSLSSSEQKRLQNWLQTRLHGEPVRLFFQ